MVDSRKFVKVFIASPGDLQEERRAAKSVVDKFNKIWADHLGYHVELVGWEDTVSNYGRPQDVINRDLERCEFFIGMLWKRWGTPPSASGNFTSGFEEEFQTSVCNRKRRGSPEISLFFKKVDDDSLRDPGDQLKKVVAFKGKIIAGKAILFETFDGIEEFQEKIERCITRYVQDLQSNEARDPDAKSKARSPENSSPNSITESPSTSETPFSLEGAKFLQDLITKTESDAEQERIPAVDAARFRLLASVIGNQGNDEQFLGVHDANILFVHRSDLALSRREQMGLIDSALSHYTSENTPLWHWLAAFDAFNRSWLQVCTLVDPTVLRVGALSAMRLVQEPVYSEDDFGRDECMRSWFSETAPSALKVAALRYLADCGMTADLTAIKAELDRGDYQTTSAAVDAILRINLRDSREKAILALYELQPESTDLSLLTALFENGVSIDTHILSQGVGHRSPKVRRMVVRLLRERGALDIETANKLTSDSDAEVRFEALQSLVDAGKQFSDDDAKKILVKPKPSHRASLLGGFGFNESEGEDFRDQFRKQRMAAMTDRELEQMASDDLVIDRDAQFVLDDRQFSKFGDQLRTAVDDNFEAEFAEKLNKLTEQVGSDSDLIQQFRNLEVHLRKGYTREGLDIICRKGDPQDLTRVRNVLKGGFVGHSAADIEYLRKFGEWEDILLIIATLDHPESGSAGLRLSASDKDKYRTVTRTIYSLGRTRLEELLSLTAPSGLLSNLIVIASEKGFRRLSDSSITQLFHSEHDVVRKAAALKCIRALPKRRLASLLNDYVSGGSHRYYNVVHWLDLGVSIPTDRARSAAETVLGREW